jgi:hypothetical protein
MLAKVAVVSSKVDTPSVAFLHTKNTTTFPEVPGAFIGG